MRYKPLVLQIKKFIKTALGATDSVDWSYDESTKETIVKLKQEGYQIVSIETGRKQCFFT